MLPGRAAQPRLLHPLARGVVAHPRRGGRPQGEYVPERRRAHAPVPVPVPREGRHAVSETVLHERHGSDAHAVHLRRAVDVRRSSGRSSTEAEEAFKASMFKDIEKLPKEAKNLIEMEEAATRRRRS